MPWSPEAGTIRPANSRPVEPADNSLGQHNTLGREYVADLRATSGRRAGDPAVHAQLNAVSGEFRDLWAQREVTARRTTLRSAPALGVTPGGGVFVEVVTGVEVLEANRGFAEPRNQVIAVTPALRERALTKKAGLTSALTDALVLRGLPVRSAALSAAIGWAAALTEATRGWFNQPDIGLEEQLTMALTDVRALVAAQLAGAAVAGRTSGAR